MGILDKAIFNEKFGSYTTPRGIITFAAVAPEHALASEAARTNPALASFIDECKKGGVQEADLGVYRATFGLPPCTIANGCFRKEDQRGGNRFPAPDAGWSQEISLDLDMVSAACRTCHILLVEADSPDMPSLGAAENMLMEALVLGKPAVSAIYWTLSKPVVELHRYIPHSTDPKQLTDYVQRLLGSDERKSFKEKASLLVRNMDNPIAI